MPGVRYALKAIRDGSQLPENPTLGQRLRFRRLELRLLQKEAAVQVGVDPKTWMWWEADQREPCVYRYPAIIDFLGREPWPAPRTFSDQLLAHRRRNGLSTRAAASSIGADQGTWLRWERGDWTPQARLSRRLQLLLNVLELRR